MNLVHRRAIALTLALVLASVSLGETTTAHAAEPAGDASATANEVESAKLKQKGDEAFDALRHEDAITFYTQAYALSPNPALLYNRGRSKQALGRFPEALVDLEQFSRTAPPEVRAKVPGIDKLVADVRARVGDLVVTCDVPGARLVVRDRVMGPVTGETYHLNTGEARIDVSLEGYYAFTKTVDLRGGQVTRVEVTLHPSRPAEGLLVVRGPLRATVLVDGVNLGQPPVERPLLVGEHRVVVHQDGYDDAEKSVVLTAHARTEIELQPTAKPPLYAKPLFWGVVTAVAVGVVAVVVIANTKASPDTGTLGQVSGPLVRF
jgi:hypothetical protein